MTTTTTTIIKIKELTDVRSKVAIRESRTEWMTSVDL